jgi:phosphoribosylamine--glycine ligase
VKVGGDFSEVMGAAETKGIDLTIVGPEAPLAEGIVDAFTEGGLKIMGPTRAAAQIESSKSFAKEIMEEGVIPTGQAESFTEAEGAVRYLKSLTAPYVIKADGLAAGKGVFIAKELEAAEQNIRDNLEGRMFGESSARVLVEEYLEGEEASLIAFTDGEAVLPMISAQDHKPIYDGDQGPNTGGMGSYSPAPLITSELHKDITDKVLRAAVGALRKRGIRYKGILYAGLIITADGPKVLEFNCRFGDPETQSMLPLMESDLAEVALALVEERLSEIELKWRKKSAVCVIMASGGYPGSYEKGKVISGLEGVPSDEKTIVFHAGTKREGGQVLTNGGRVLGLTTLDDTLEGAIERNYDLIKGINFENCYYRKDIGLKALRRKG